MINIYNSNDSKFLTLKRYLEDRNLGSASFFVVGKQMYYFAMTTVSKKLALATELVMLQDKKDPVSKNRLEELNKKLTLVCKCKALNVTDIYWENVVSGDHIDLRVDLKGIEDEINVKYSFIDNQVLDYSYSVISQFVSEKVYTTSNEMRASLKLMLKGYLQKAINQAIQDKLLKRYAVGWNEDSEFDILVYQWTEEQEAFGENTNISADEIKTFVKKVLEYGVEVIFMFLYALAAFSHPRIYHRNYGRQPVLNVYCKDKEKLHTYANLFFNISGMAIGDAHTLYKDDYISISSNSVDNNKFFLYANIPVIVSKNGNLNASNRVIKKIIGGLGEKIRFFPVIISENKVTEDNIISICLDGVKTLGNFGSARKLFQYLCYKYVDWSEQKLFDKCKITIPRYNQFDEQFARSTFLYEYSVAKYASMVSLSKGVLCFLKQEYEIIYEEKQLQNLLACVIEKNREIEKVTHKNYVDDFIKFFNEKVVTKENIENQVVIRAEDSKDAGEYYYVKGNFWAREFLKTFGLNISENKLKKILNQKDMLGHFQNGTRTGYTVTRSFHKKKYPYYRFSAEPFE